MTLADNFKNARSDRKIVSVAKELDCSPGYLSTVEQGKNTPSPTFCEEAAEKLTAPEIAVNRWAAEVELLEEALTQARTKLQHWQNEMVRKYGQK